MTHHDPNRRAKLARTLVDLIADHGLEGVSVRDVAQRANVSIGAVQHHFPTRASMLLAAADLVGEAWKTTLEEALPRETAVETLRLVARHLLPAGADSRIGRVWLAFVAQAAVDKEIATVLEHDWRLLEERLARLIAATRAERSPESEQRDMSDEAAALLALLDGLAVAIITEPQRMPVERAYALLDHYLDSLLDGLPSTAR